MSEEIKKVLVTVTFEVEVEPEYYVDCPTPKDMVKYDYEMDPAMFISTVNKFEVVEAKYSEEE